MTTKNKVAGEKPGANPQKSKQLNVFDDVIIRAGGISALSRSIGVTPKTFNHWKKQGSLPWVQAIQLQYLYGTCFKDHICDDDAVFVALMQLERSLGELRTATQKTLRQTSAVVDTMMKQRQRTAKNVLFSEKGA